MEKRQELYRGKAKTVYATDDPHLLVMHFRDDTSAFDGVNCVNRMTTISSFGLTQKNVLAAPPQP